MPYMNEVSTTSGVTLVSCRRCGAFSDEIVCERCEGLRFEALRWLRDLNEDPAENAGQDVVFRLRNPE